MLFNSIQFVFFFPAVVAAYFLCPARLRWALLLAASYYFYACWKAEYLVLIIASTALDYAAGLVIDRSGRHAVRKAWLVASLSANLGLLFAFKYANFFNESLRSAFDAVNVFYGVPAFELLLPVGISFYTFQSMSYTIDVYRRERRAERHAGIFALYVAFFPQLVAGPIERSSHLMPQFRETMRWNTARVLDGLQLMLWGFFKKLVIADRLALYVNEVFNHPGQYEGAAVLLAGYCFAFQIYCDFSAYSDIAVGTARVMGYDLMDNFKRPYFATSIADFWRRWHISLSTWFRDYVYRPLGGSRVTKRRFRMNIAAVFLLSGLWHGANWTFVVWGALHAAYYLIGDATAAFRDRAAAALGLIRAPRVHYALKAVVTFHLVVLAWFFFRAGALSDAWTLLASIPQGPFLPDHWGLGLAPHDLAAGLGAVSALLAIDAIAHRPGARSPFGTTPPFARAAFAYALAMAILVLGKTGANAFIYFQF